MGYVVAAWCIAGGLLAAYGVSIALRRRAVEAEAADIAAERTAEGSASASPFGADADAKGR